MTTLNPYLNFNGQAKEAMEFYHFVLGGKLSMQTFGEGGMPDVPKEDKNLIIHARLEAEGIMIMASDGGKMHKVDMGNSVQLSIQGEDKETLTKYFNGLSAGGKVTMPLAKQFWGDTFGMFTDKFGMHWMVNILAPKK